MDCDGTPTLLLLFVASAKLGLVRVFERTFLPANTEAERLAATPESVRHRSISSDTDDRVDEVAANAGAADQLNE
jgi:hypothetical protein